MHGVGISQSDEPSVLADWSSQDDGPRYELNGMNFCEYVHFQKHDRIVNGIFHLKVEMSYTTYIEWFSPSFLGSVGRKLV